MTAKRTRAKTDQLAKTYWLITTAPVLQAIQERTAMWVRNIGFGMLCCFSDEQPI